MNLIMGVSPTDTQWCSMEISSHPILVFQSTLLSSFKYLRHWPSFVLSWKTKLPMASQAMFSPCLLVAPTLTEGTLKSLWRISGLPWKAAKPKGVLPLLSLVLTSIIICVYILLGNFYKSLITTAPILYHHQIKKNIHTYLKVPPPGSIVVFLTTFKSPHEQLSRKRSMAGFHRSMLSALSAPT